jgi:hypothetical protein
MPRGARGPKALYNCNRESPGEYSPSGAKKQEKLTFAFIILQYNIEKVLSKPGLRESPCGEKDFVNGERR